MRLGLRVATLAVERPRSHTSACNPTKSTPVAASRDFVPGSKNATIRSGARHFRNLGVAGMPTGQGWTVLGDVAGGPEDALLVHLRGHFTVGTDDVEIAPGNPRQHRVDD